jgi:hypothetical protein
VNGTILLSQLQDVADVLDEVHGDTSSNRVDLTQIRTESMLTLQSVIDAMDGGLTQEEHDYLLSIPTVGLLPGDIWGYTLQTTDMNQQDPGRMAQTVLTDLWHFLAFKAGYEGLPVPNNPWFHFVAVDPYYTGSWLGFWTASGSSHPVPQLDLTLVDLGDTVLAYLQREYPSYAWTTDGPGSSAAQNKVWLTHTGSPKTWYYWCTLTDADLAGIWREQEIITEEPIISVVAAPLWPGVAGATMGDEVALTAQLDLAEPMHGIRVHVTTPPTKTGVRSIGGRLMYYGIGECAFYNDQNWVEPWQYMGFTDAIYTPRTMEIASGCLFRVLAGAGGTVTPWTRT